MAIDSILAHQQEITRLNHSIEQLKARLENNLINDDEYKQLVMDCGRCVVLGFELNVLQREQNRRRTASTNP
ncbi:unnamed protein product [Rotaria magnacalcarata]|uniref:Uncharacterized protein n=1 Tax=Rotaria magnacalcarata TaxID=392030 RepID=A0A814MEN1_9BILA|nr:unnamed protein product [Rotaria magnacalcarata]